MLRKLYSWLRVSMKSDRLDNLGHPERLSLIKNEKILEIFVSRNHRRFDLVPVRARVMVGNDIPPIMFLGFIAIQTLTQTEENTYFVNRPKTGQNLSLLFSALVSFFI